MNQLATPDGITTPALVIAAGERAGVRFLRLGDPQSTHAPCLCTRAQ